jgi:hypothetical protein
MCKTREFVVVFYFRNSLHPPQLLVLFMRVWGRVVVEGHHETLS